MLAKIRAYEPVRLYGFTLVGLVLAGLGAKGLITGEVSDWIMMGATIVIGPSAVEAARNRVTPEAKKIGAVQDSLEDLRSGLQAVLTHAGPAVPPEARELFDRFSEAIDYYGRNVGGNPVSAGEVATYAAAPTVVDRA